VKWILEIGDKVSGPAGAGALALGKEGEALKHVGEDSEGAGSSLSKLGETFKIAELKAKLLEKGLELVVEGLHKTVEEAVEFGKFAIEAGDFKRSTEIGFEALLGSKEAAKETIDKAEALSIKTGIPLKALVGSFNELAAAKIKPEQFSELTLAASDLSKISGGTVGLQSVVDAFKDIAGKGELAGRDLLQFKVIGQDLAKALGQTSFRELQKSLELNPVKADRGIRAILDTIKKLGGGTEVGALTERVGNGVAGGLEKIHNAFEKMLGDLADSPLIDRIGTLLGNVAKELDSGEGGKRLRQDIAYIAEKAGALIENLVSHPKILEDFFARALAVGETFWHLLEKIAGVIDTISSVWGGLKTAANYGVDIANFGTTDYRKGAESKSRAQEAAEFAEAPSAALGAGTASESDLTEISKSLGIPAFASGGDVYSPTLALIGEAGPEHVGPMGEGGGHGAVTVHVDVGGVHIEGAGKVGEELADLIGQKLQEVLPGAAISWLEKAGMQGA
jgi:hypothetical protein